VKTEQGNKTVRCFHLALSRLDAFQFSEDGSRQSLLTFIAVQGRPIPIPDPIPWEPKQKSVSSHPEIPARAPRPVMPLRFAPAHHSSRSKPPSTKKTSGTHEHGVWQRLTLSSGLPPLLRRRGSPQLGRSTIIPTAPPLVTEAAPKRRGRGYRATA